MLGEAARRQRESELERVQAKERGFLFVFNEDSGLLAWANPSVDITSDVG